MKTVSTNYMEDSTSRLGIRSAGIAFLRSSAAAALRIFLLVVDSHIPAGFSAAGSPKISRKQWSSICR